MAAWPYSTAAWQRLRQAKLAEEPLCRLCLEGGRLVPAEHVDHVTPINQGGDPLPPLAGLDALCASCHSRKTYHVDTRKAAIPSGPRVDPATGLPAEGGHWWHK